MAETGVVLRVNLVNYYKVRSQLEALESRYRGAFRDTIKHMLNVMRDYAEQITHVETGTLASSHEIYYNPRRLSGYIYVGDLQKLRGNSRQIASEYGIYEHRRGGDHAFYERALNEMGHQIGWEGIRMMIDYLD